MINSVFVNLNGIDINVLNIEYIKSVTHFNFRKYRPQYDEGQSKTIYNFNNISYVISSEGCEGWEGEIKKYCFKIIIFNYTLLSNWYDSFEECDISRNIFKSEVDSILKEYGHMLLENGIKKINV